ncbi:MAG TPA: hypothetical protein DE027_00135 [Candidatus Marinimicrobia bacterium]|nr:hypothetical protein [Candidatus Neomarinimicrobiota bacterium]
MRPFEIILFILLGWATINVFYSPHERRHSKLLLKIIFSVFLIHLFLEAISMADVSSLYLNRWNTVNTKSIDKFNVKIYFYLFVCFLVDAFHGCTGDQNAQINSVLLLWEHPTIIG